jgi:hypothetical protein
MEEFERLRILSEIRYAKSSASNLLGEYLFSCELLISTVMSFPSVAPYLRWHLERLGDTHDLVFLSHYAKWDLQIMAESMNLYFYPLLKQNGNTDVPDRPP